MYDIKYINYALLALVGINSTGFLVRSMYSEKPIVAFTTSTVFILDFYIYD